MNFREKFEDFDKTQKLGSEITKGLIKYFTPKWFEFLGWLFALGGLLYFWKLSKSIPILIIFLFSLFLFYEFLEIQINSIRSFLGKFSKGIFSRIIIWGLSLIIVFIVYFIISGVVLELSINN